MTLSFFLSSSAENPPLLRFRDSNGSLLDGRRVHSRGERLCPKRPLLKCWGGRSCSWLLFLIKMKKPACERRGKGFAPEYDFGGHDSGFRCPSRARSLIRRGAGSRGHGEQGSQRHGDGAMSLGVRTQAGLPWSAGCRMESQAAPAFSGKGQSQGHSQKHSRQNPLEASEMPASGRR